VSDSPGKKPTLKLKKAAATLEELFSEVIELTLIATTPARTQA